MAVLANPRKLLRKPVSTFLTNPVSAFPDFFDNGFFNSDWMRERFVPAVNIIEEDKRYVVEMAAPGLKKSDFYISVDNGMMIISNELEKEDKVEDDNYIRREYNYSSFNRSFTFPENAKEENIEAKYQNGVLRVFLNKKKETKPKMTKEIKVK